jgi:hypothetical protein
VTRFGVSAAFRHPDRKGPVPLRCDYDHEAMAYEPETPAELGPDRGARACADFGPGAHHSIRSAGLARFRARLPQKNSPRRPGPIDTSISCMSVNYGGPSPRLSGPDRA